MIDFLPRQVPKDADGQFFRIENYMLNNYEHYGLRDKFIRTILKLMCYCRVIVHWSEWIEQPAPELIAEIVDTIMDNHSGYMNMLLPDKNALLAHGEQHWAEYVFPQARIFSPSNKITP